MLVEHLFTITGFQADIFTLFVTSPPRRASACYRAPSSMFFSVDRPDNRIYVLTKYVRLSLEIKLTYLRTAQRIILIICTLVRAALFLS